MPSITAGHYCRDVFAELTPFVPPGWSPQQVLDARGILVAHAPDHLKPLFDSFVNYLENVATQDPQDLPAVLDYRGTLLPGLVTQFVGEKMPLALLPNDVDGLPPLSKASATLLDLGWNSLTAEDITAVVAAVNKLPAGAERRLTISLRNNRLYDCVTQLRDLLQHQAVKFVDVSLNALASIESKDKFLKLTKAELGRLIFLQPFHLRDFGEQPLRDIIEQAHRIYFASIEFRSLNSPMER